jgi:hypothetical protein
MAAEEPERSVASSSFRSSLAALVLGIAIAVTVSKIFEVIGWGGELASQAAGAASGAAPLLIDFVRQRGFRRIRGPIAQWVRWRQSPPPVLTASLFGFAVLLFDSVFGLVMVRMTKYVIKVSGGDAAKFSQAYLLVGGAVVVPVVLIVTAALAVFASHRLQPHPRRWLCFGIGVYLLVRILMFVISPPGPEDPTTTPILIVSAILTAGLLVAATMVAEVLGRRSQPTYSVTAYFRRLSPDDQYAALALLAEQEDGLAAGLNQTSGSAPPPGRRRRRDH